MVRAKALAFRLWRPADVCFGGVFVLAGMLKLADPSGFAVDIGNFRILPFHLTKRLSENW